MLKRKTLFKNGQLHLDMYSGRFRGMGGFIPHRPKKIIIYKALGLYKAKVCQMHPPQ